MSAMRVSQPARAPSTDDVHDRLRSLIVSGRIAPGTRLIELELARHLEVSRTPVREAMRRLAHEGLASIVGTGAKTQFAAAAVTRADLVDLFAIIGALEGIAGRGVAALTPPARRALAADLAAKNGEFETLARKAGEPTARFFAAHDAFHATLVERSASARLRDLIATVRPQIARYELFYAQAVGGEFRESVREHRAIAAAVRTGTPDAVERAIRRNWSNSAARLVAGTRTALSAMGDFRSMK
jgi:DNA-binding GntR family transcriptional regulator